ncbi:hypothetical protein G6F57_007782 [Rhizopus arrhizus]|uniref:Uncharacterized protein n=1 Tax=Rhizopus oryzae TaxID=64495 RepID=A0A9P6X6R6_RHIOR|nr:hypothetical protein G6F24_007161 [Rhizopus arrhizus]KAG1428993.1 hypothetical protein G6F58_000274 [Rhizopus delemar]KAG0778842.1 hypothetical protein G6F22_010993 [Rhizopus arrhizus]KAG0787839.1 hypothetical protein G6F21_007632 [Rhizopus arrhizus]KAG0810963.1 hypothetical protein G6F20_007536 [Rhizopus arrhizus]
MCCGGGNGPKWKREVVKDHKFDYVDINEFYDPSCCAYLNYMFMFLIILKGFLVYVADLWTAVSLLVIGTSSENEGAAIPPEISKWIFLGAIMISFILLFWDIKKARGIIDSRDISYAFTSVIANRYYSVKDYKYFCLFRRINNSRKRIDSIAFFVFFTLKGWKRLLLAEAPRQVVNIVTLITIVPHWIQIKNGVKIQNEILGKTIIQQIMTGTMAFSVLIFGISFILVCIAAIVYIPLLCHIQGNLKEYCCHKVDKRIAELLRKQARMRVENNMKAQHVRNEKDDIEMRSFPKPTLPKVNMDNLAANNNPYPHNNYYQQQPYHYNNNNNLSAPFVRRNSLSSVNSDQAGLISHAQGQPYSSPFYYQNNNGSNVSIVRPNNNYNQQAYYTQQQQPQYNYSQNHY